jgi:hypothetical protein
MLLWLLACNSPNGATHWIQWEQVELPGDAAGLRAEIFCGDYLYAGGQRFSAATGALDPMEGGTPGHPVTGEFGPVTCLDGDLFTAPPKYGKAYRAQDGGPFEAYEDPQDGAFYSSIMAGQTRGEVYRVTEYWDANLPPIIQLSTDGGDTWETTAIAPWNPGGGEAQSAWLTHVESYVEFAVLDVEQAGGLLRSNFDGDMSLSTVNSFGVDLDIPSPDLVFDGMALATNADSISADLPRYGSQHFYATNADPFDATVHDYEPLLHAGLFFWGVPAANDMFRLVQDPQGHLVMRTDGVAYRSTHPWTESQREVVIQDKDCERLEWSDEKFGDKERDDGPGQVTFTHSGGEPVMLAVLEDNEPVWKNEQVLEDGYYVYDPLEEGEEITLVSDDYPLLVMSQSGVCLEVLTAGEDSEVDVGR